MKMNRRKGAALLLMSCLLLQLGVMGCGAPDETVQQETGAQEENDSNTGMSRDAETSDASTGQSEGTDDVQSGKYSATTGDADVENLFSTADIDGKLVEISDAELKVAPVQVIDENTIVMVQDGESAEDIVYVAVSDSTVFQIMRIDIASLSLIEIKDTDKSGMTEESSVLVYGSKQDETHWSADKVILVKWE